MSGLTGEWDVGNCRMHIKDGFLDVGDFYTELAIDIIKDTYGDDVSVVQKKKNLIKFGRSSEVQTATKTTLMTLPSGIYNETYVSDNLITTISSASALDTAANNASDIVIEGHTVDGNGDFTFVVQTAALNGQNQITLTTPLARTARLYNDDTAEMTGPVYVYEDDTSTLGVPDTSTGVHIMLRGGEQQSEKASTTISSTDYWLIHGAYCDMLSKNDWNAEVGVELRLKGKVFRKAFDMSCSKGSGTFRSSKPYIIVPKNTDIRMRALSSNANAIVSGGIFGTLLKVI